MAGLLQDFLAAGYMGDRLSTHVAAIACDSFIFTHTPSRALGLYKRFPCVLHISLALE